MHEVSVVIPVLNGIDTLSEQLDAVLSQEGVDSFEVVIVDNGSTDGTVELVKRYAARDDRLRLVDGATAPKGGAAAKNLGVEAANSDLVAFCDADDVVRPGWLKAIREGLRTSTAVLVTREYWTLNPHLSHRYQSRTVLTGLVLGVPSISGGAFGIWRDAYLAIGGFDETLGGAVDSEFSIRFMRAGYSAHPVPDAEVCVRLSNSARQLFRRRRLLARSSGEIQVLHSIRASEYSWPAVAKTGGALLLHSHRLLKRAERFAWVQTAGSFVGKLEAMSALAFRRRWPNERR